MDELPLVAFPARILADAPLLLRFKKQRRGRQSARKKGEED